MPARFKFSPADEAFGLYTVPTPDSTDDDPLTDPLNHLDRVIIHPALRYPGVVSVLTGSLSLAATGSGGFAIIRRTHVLGAHGQTGRPMIVGKLTGLGVGGVDVPWAGSVCVQCPLITYGGATGTQRNLRNSRWLALGVQGGNVVAFEVCNESASAPAAITVNYEVLILDRDLTATLPNSGPSRCRINGSEFEFVTPKGTLTSAHRYLREGIGAGSFALSGGRTVTLRYNGTVGTSVVNETTFKNSFGSSVYEVNVDNVIRTSSPTNLPANAVNPQIKTVKL